MLKALEKAIYYTDRDDLFASVINLSYENEENFLEICNNLHNNIEVIASFGNKDNICYSIFQNIGRIYNELLLDKTSSIFIVNRRGESIKLFRNVDTTRVAIIKIDAVLSEYKESSNKKHFFFYPLTFLLGMMTYSFIKNY